MWLKMKNTGLLCYHRNTKEKNMKFKQIFTENNEKSKLEKELRELRANIFSLPENEQLDAERRIEEIKKLLGIGLHKTKRIRKWVDAPGRIGTKDSLGRIHWKKNGYMTDYEQIIDTKNKK